MNVADADIEALVTVASILRRGHHHGLATQMESLRRRIAAPAREPGPLTVKQAEVLEYLRLYIEDLGYAPSFAEIAEACGYSSLGTVHEHLSHLERKGYIRRDFNMSRGIALTEAGQ